MSNTFKTEKEWETSSDIIMIINIYSASLKETGTVAIHTSLVELFRLSLLSIANNCQRP